MIRSEERIVTRKTLKELLFSGKPSRDGGEENNDLLKIWKCQEEEEGQSEKTKSFRAISFVVSLLGIACCCWSEPESWFLLSDLHEPEWSKSSDRSLGWFKSTRVQRPELFWKVWMWFKWVAFNCLVFLVQAIALSLIWLNFNCKRNNLDPSLLWTKSCIDELRRLHLHWTRMMEWKYIKSLQCL